MILGLNTGMTISLGVTSPSHSHISKIKTSFLDLPPYHILLTWVQCFFISFHLTFFFLFAGEFFRLGGKQIIVHCREKSDSFRGIYNPTASSFPAPPKPRSPNMMMFIYTGFGSQGMTSWCSWCYNFSKANFAMGLSGPSWYLMIYTHTYINQKGGSDLGQRQD